MSQMSSSIRVSKGTVAEKTSSASRQVVTAPTPSHDFPAYPAREAILQMQQTLGNRAFERLWRSGYLQKKLHIGPANDFYEQEADAVAEKVVSMPVPANNPGGETSSPSPGLAGNLSSAPSVISRTPLVNTITPLRRSPGENPKDRQEELQEKEHDKDELQGMFIQTASTGEDDEVQKSPAKKDEELQGAYIPRYSVAGFMAQRKELGRPAPSNVESSIYSARGGGRALSTAERSYFEPRFGADFSGVKIHTGGRANDLARSVNARAFTVGSDIFFGSGQYSSHTSEGKKLMAHELTHTVQQGGVARAKEMAVSNAPVKIQRGFFDDPFGSIVSGVKSFGSSIVSGAKSLGTTFVSGIKKVGSAIGDVLALAFKKAKNFALGLLKSLPGYDLITGLFGNPLESKKQGGESTGFVKTIFKLIGKEDVYNNIVEANIFGKIANTIKGALTSNGLTWAFLSKNISSIWEFLKSNPLSWSEAAGRIKDFIVSLISKVLGVGRVLLYKVKVFIFEAFMNMAGPAGKQVLGILSKNPTALKKLIESPVYIIKMFFQAIRKGFDNFKDNFITHFKNAAMEWIFGTLAEGGLQLPQKFDLAGIFSLVFRVLNLTYQAIRKKVVDGLAKVVGPEKAEKGVSLVEKGVEIVRRIINEGPIALWDMVKEKLSDLKDMVIGGIVSWARDTIITKAILKLVSMLNPAGAIIQAAIMIYDVVMFFVNNWTRIKAVVNAIFSAIAMAALGQVGQAATFVEQTMAKGLTLMISFLARLVGLGGIAEKVKEVISKIRKPVDAAIEKVVGFIIKLATPLIKVVDKAADKITGALENAKEKGRSMVEGAKEKVVGWLGLRKQFKNTAGETHTLFFEGSENSAVLYIASRRENYIDFINRIDNNNPHKTKALAKATEINQTRSKTTKNDIEKEQKAERIRTLVNEMAEITALIAEPGGPLPPSVVTFGSLTGDGGATKMEARILSSNNVKGSSPSDNPPIWQMANRRLPTSSFIQGHLLNDNLGGPGRRFNLTPITGNQGPSHGGNYANGEHLHKVEQHVKNLVLEQNKVVKYTVEVDYSRHEPRSRTDLTGNTTEKEKIMDYEETHLAKGLRCNWHVLRNENGQWVRDTTYTSSPSVGENIYIENKLPRGDFEYQ